MSLLDNPFGMKPRQSPDEIYRVLTFGFFMIVALLLFDNYTMKPQRDALAARQAATQGQTVAAPQPVSRAEALADNAGAASRVTLENAHMKASINLVGARLDDLILKDYYVDLDKTENIALLSPSASVDTQWLQMGWLADNAQTAVPGADTTWTMAERTDNSVKLRWTSPQNVVFVQDISWDDKYLFTVKRNVQNNSGRNITLYPFNRVVREGKHLNPQQNAILHEGMIAYVNGELEQTALKKMDKQGTMQFEQGHGWIGITEKYWLAAILNPPSSAVSDFRFTTGKGQFDRPLYQADTRGAAQTLTAGTGASSIDYLFVGPKVVSMLDDYSKQLDVAHFDLAVDFGRFYFLTRPFFELLHFLSGLVGSFAVGLLLTSLVIRGATFPLANTTYRSFAKLRKLAPMMQEIKEKYGADRQKMQQEIFAMYQREKVNPAAGCFPMLLQIPIFFALYKVIFITIEMRHAPFFGWVQDMSAPDPTSIFNLFGLLPFNNLPEFLMIGAWPCIYCITMLLLQRLQAPPTDPSQRMMMRILPFVFTYMLAHFPAGLVIYWSWSNLLSIVQQTIIMRSMGVEVHLFHSPKHKVQDVEIFDTKDDVVLQTVEAIEVPNEEPAQITPPKRGKKKK